MSTETEELKITPPFTKDQISLWSDPRWKEAAQNMGKEKLETYKKLGEDFNSIDYTTGESQDVPIPEPVANCIAYIEAGIRSGLREEDLAEDELKLLIDYLGSDWKKSFGIENPDNEQDK